MSIFSVAPSFFDGARLLYSDVPVELEAAQSQEEAAAEQIDEAEEADATLTMKKWTCSTCKLKFDSGDEQRSHFKSDFHRLNVKRKLAGKPALDEEAFERFAEGTVDDESGVSSISGSDTESEDESGAARAPRKLGRQIPFLLGNGSVAEVWRCVLMSDKEKLEDKNTPANGDPSIVAEGALLSRLKNLPRPSDARKVTWVVLLSTGGHFAGVVLDMKSNVVQAHQTYHRYVVRAKAGGKQSTKDGAGRAPKSAGASLRRYNEMALQKEIKGLLQSWRPYLADADCIFVFAPSSNNQSLFGEEPLLNRQDPRIRSIPFSTKRPTLKEAKRVCSLLASLPLRSKEELDKEEVILTAKKEDSKPKPPVQQQEAVSDTRSTHTKDRVVEETCPAEALTPLHEASIAGNTARVLSLLEQGADPCVKARGRTPYLASADKETRNVYRKFMAAHPDKWDWNAASVPSPLTDEQEAAQIAKQEEKNAMRKAKEKQRRKERKAQQKADETKEKATAESKKLEAEEEARTAVVRERELRAAAAEARMRGNSSGASSEPCSYCGGSLGNQVPFSKHSYKYCSIPCVNAHRKVIEQD